MAIDIDWMRKACKTLDKLGWNGIVPNDYVLCWPAIFCCGSPAVAIGWPWSLHIAVHASYHIMKPMQLDNLLQISGIVCSGMS